MTLIIPIASLPSGTPASTDLYPAVDINDVSEAPTGTTKKYTIAQLATYILTFGGYTYLAPCRVATTANLGATYNNGTLGVGATLTNNTGPVPLSIDGVPMNVGDRILVKNQTVPAQNGVYTVMANGSVALSNWVLVRAPDWDISAEMFDHQIVQIGTGVINNNTVWTSQLTYPVIVGTDPINFIPFSFTAGQPLTKVNDINVTLTLTGSSATALVNAAGLTLGWTGTLAITRGGTGVGSVTVSPTASAWAGWDASKNLSANNFLPGYTTTVTAAGTTTLTVASTYTQYFTGATTQTVLMPVVSTLVLGQPYYFFNNSSGNVTVQSSGGNNIQVMAPGTSLYMTCIAVTGTTAASWNAEYAFNGGSGSGTVSPGSINQIAWYAANGTVVSGLPTANNGVLVTSAGGVPSISTTLPTGLTIPGYLPLAGGTMTGNIVMSGKDIQFDASHGLIDSNGNNVILIVPVASAVNYFNFVNSASGGTLGINAAGSDANIILGLSGKGTSGVAIRGTSDGSNVSSGYVGEYIESIIVSGSGLALASTTPKDVTSISLTAGDWDVWGNVHISGSGFIFTILNAWINTSSATLVDAAFIADLHPNADVSTWGVSIATRRVSISSPATLYLSGLAFFGSGSATISGFIAARRVR